MTKHLAEDPAIRRQLRKLLAGFEDRMSTLGAGSYHGWDAGDLAAMLAGGGTGDLRIGPCAGTEMIATGLLERGDLEDPEFWGSPLGRAVAFWGTGKPASVSRACAAAALGCGRANLSLMVRKGQLSEDQNSKTYPLRITTASLAHAMRVRHPLGG